MNTIHMSDYTVGVDAYDAIPEICHRYGAQSICLVSDQFALKAAKPALMKGLAGSNISITGEIDYVAAPTRSMMERLANDTCFIKADVIMAIGGGGAIDIIKAAADKLNKTVFTVPTICSNCAAATAIAVVYTEDGKPDGYVHPKAPAHIFINPEVIAQAPSIFMWAGVGDALSKQPEVEYSSSKATLDHTGQLGVALAHTCTENLMKYGEQAIIDCENHVASEAVEQVALTILISTGYVSNLTNQPEYYYNSSLAHAFFNASLSIEREGKKHLHGEVVSFGVLCLFAYMGNDAELERYARFNKKIHLPVTLSELDLDESHLPALAKAATQTNEWKWGNPDPFDEQKFIEAILKADAFGRSL